MPYFIVGHIDWFSHDLALEKHEALSHVEAIKKHSKVQDMDWGNAVTVEQMKVEAFNCDSMVASIEVEKP